MRLNVFGDVTGHVSDQDEPNAFVLGQLDFVATSMIDPHWRALAEVVFEANDENTSVIDVERLQIRWTPDAFLALTLGRMHQPLGYYNTAYHHGALFQDAIERPRAVRFEDEGGILPVHVTGAELAGRSRYRTFQAGFTMSVGNGRGRFPDEVPIVNDLNRHKSVNGHLYVEERRSGVRIGMNVLSDRIPEWTDDTTGTLIHSEMDELIRGAYVAVDRGALRLIVEGYRVEHQLEEDDNVLATQAGFVEASVAMERARPYLRYESIDFPSDIDPFYDPLAPGTDQTAFTAGLKVDASTRVALKFEYTRTDTRNVREAVHAGAFQAAFSF